MKAGADREGAGEGKGEAQNRGSKRPAEAEAEAVVEAEADFSASDRRGRLETVPAAPSTCTVTHAEHFSTAAPTVAAAAAPSKREQKRLKKAAYKAEKKEEKAAGLGDPAGRLRKVYRAVTMGPVPLGPHRHYANTRESMANMVQYESIRTGVVRSFIFLFGYNKVREI